MIDSFSTQNSELRTKKSTHRNASIFSYYWEFLTVMNRASTNLVVSGFRKE